MFSMTVQCNVVFLFNSWSIFLHENESTLKRGFVKPPLISLGDQLLDTFFQSSRRPLVENGFHTLDANFTEYWDLNNIHYDDVIMGAIASQITSLTIVYSPVYSGADQSKHQSSASLAFVWGIHRGPVNSPHKWPVTRKMFPFDDVIMW